MRFVLRTVLAALVLCCLTSLVRSDQPAVGKEHLEFFEAKIRPVLVAECYQCHSAEAEKSGKLRGGLLLDSRDATRAGGESGPAVVPGKVDESLLISALRHESFEMPPKGKLPQEVIDDFVKWIELGAPDPRDGAAKAQPAQLDIQTGRKYWAFQPLEKLAPPRVDDPRFQAWNENPVDQFIVAKQLSERLTPSALATPRVLIRRAWFDLLGLPPTSEQMRRWEKRIAAVNGDGTISVDQKAWGQLIDELLQQPQYGERWARHWLDIARFAESHGYEQDYDRPTAYHYRDFLIKAFNADMPYDQFVRWQLAGDELAPEDPLAWMATGFLGAGAFPTQLTEDEFESARYDELDDMVGTTGVAFLGLSIGCARCHDHKFDPIGSEDYYRMAATFTKAIRAEKELDLDPEANRQRQADYDRRLQAAREKLSQYDRDTLPAAFAEWLKQPAAAGELEPWHALKGELESTAKTKFKEMPDSSYLATGNAPARDEWKLSFALPPGRYYALRIEALTDDSLPRQGPGRADNGNFCLSHIQLQLTAHESDSRSDAEKMVALGKVEATFQQNAESLSARASLDEDRSSSGWAVDGQIGKSQAAVFHFAEPLELKAETTDARLTLMFQHSNPRHAIGRVRVSISPIPAPPVAVGQKPLTSEQATALERLQSAMRAGEAFPSLLANHASEWKVAIDWYASLAPERAQLQREIDQLEAAGPGLVLTKALVTTEGLPHLPHHADDRGFPHFYPETYVLRRGDPKQKVEVTTAAMLRVLVPEDTAATHWEIPEAERRNTRSSYQRASLARWLTDPGAGAGSLTARVMVNRLWQHHFGEGIVATPNDFGASGERPTHPELLDWLARELIEQRWHLKALHRMIMTSRTYMQVNKEIDDPRMELDPENTWIWHRPPMRLEAETIRDAMLSVSGRLDATMYGPGSLDSSMRRRSVYFFIKRSQLIPEMMLFDWPEHLVSIGRRPVTTIAPQALLFMNSAQGRESALALANTWQNLPIPEAIERVYDRLYNRRPTAREMELAEEFFKRQTSQRAEQGETDAALQALADLCQTLLSMNEFIYID